MYYICTYAVKNTASASVYSILLHYISLCYTQLPSHSVLFYSILPVLLHFILFEIISRNNPLKQLQDSNWSGLLNESKLITLTIEIKKKSQDDIISALVL